MSIDNYMYLTSLMVFVIAFLCLWVYWLKSVNAELREINQEQNRELDLAVQIITATTRALKGDTSFALFTSALDDAVRSNQEAGFIDPN